MSGFYHVHFGSRKLGTEEVHGLGWNGRRIVWISSQAKGWTHLRDPATGNTARLKTKLWDTLGAEEYPVHKKFIPAYWRKDAPVAFDKMMGEAI
jgi:hypothetical protein